MNAKFMPRRTLTLVVAGIILVLGSWRAGLRHGRAQELATPSTEPPSTPAAASQAACTFTLEMVQFTTTHPRVIESFVMGSWTDEDLFDDLEQLVVTRGAETTGWQALRAPVGETTEMHLKERESKISVSGKVSFRPPLFTVLKEESLLTGDHLTVRGDWTGEAWQLAVAWERRSPFGSTQPAWMNWDDPFSGEIATASVPRVLNQVVRGMVLAKPGEVVLLGAMHGHLQEAKDSTDSMRFIFVRAGDPPSGAGIANAPPPDALGSVEAVVLRVPEGEAMAWLRERVSDEQDEAAFRQWISHPSALVEDAARLTCPLASQDETPSGDPFAQARPGASDTGRVTSEAKVADEDFVRRAGNWDSREPTTEDGTSYGATWRCQREVSGDGQKVVKLCYNRRSPGPVLGFPWRADRPKPAIEREAQRQVGAEARLTLSQAGARLIFAAPAPERFGPSLGGRDMLLGFARLRPDRPANTASAGGGGGDVQVAFVSITDAEAAQNAVTPQVAASTIWKAVDEGTAAVLAFSQSMAPGRSSSLVSYCRPGWDTGMGGQVFSSFLFYEAGLSVEVEEPPGDKFGRIADASARDRRTLVASLDVAPPQHPAVEDLRSPESVKDGDPYMPEQFSFGDRAAFGDLAKEWRMMLLQRAKVPEDSPERGRWHAMLVRLTGGG